MKGFGQPQPTKIDKLVESAVCYCHKRHPEALDQIFDNLPVKLTSGQKRTETNCDQDFRFLYF